MLEMQQAVHVGTHGDLSAGRYRLVVERDNLGTRAYQARRIFASDPCTTCSTRNNVLYAVAHRVKSEKPDLAPGWVGAVGPGATAIIGPTHGWNE